MLRISSSVCRSNGQSPTSSITISSSTCLFLALCTERTGHLFYSPLPTHVLRRMATADGLRLRVCSYLRS